MRRRHLEFLLGFFPQSRADLKSSSFVAHAQLSGGGGGS